MKTITRRNVILTMTGTAISLCPAILNAQAAEFDWGEDVPTNVPRGEDQMVMLAAGEADFEPEQPRRPWDVCLAMVARPLKHLTG